MEKKIQNGGSLNNNKKPSWLWWVFIFSFVFSILSNL